MKIAVACLALLCGIALFTPCQAAETDSAKERTYFENLLNHMCAAGICSERPSPHTEDGAEEIIFSAMILSWLDDMPKLKELNAPLVNMGIEDLILIPEKRVEAAVCKYFGFTLDKYEGLENAAQKRRPASGFYVLGMGDPGLSTFKIKEIKPLENGLMRASGIDEENEAPFTAFFKKASCGGEDHWILLRVVSLPEETAEYKPSKDE